MAQSSLRDGPVGGGYGPTTMWWKANLFYFILGSLVYDLYCPLRFVKQLPTTEDTTGMLYWMGLVALRNLSIVVMWYGGWHHQLYTLKKLPVKEKFLAEPSYTHGYLLDRDILLSCLGSLVASGVECLVVLHWEARQASGSNALHGSPWGELLSDPLAVVFGIAVCSWWSDVHFWLAHRSMHAWLPKAWSHIDPGAALYRHVHSVHHKSFNPGPWSGLAMHPLEHLAYFTRGIICLWPALGLHPAFFYFVNTRAMIGPAVGHSGFGAAGGSHFHYLHHAHLNWNFGTSRVVPIDNLLGTYRMPPAPAPEEAEEGKDTTKAETVIVKPDASLQSLAWVFGLPYLLPLWLCAHHRESITKSFKERLF